MKEFYKRYHEVVNAIGIIVLLVVVFVGIFFVSENIGDRSLDKAPSVTSTPEVKNPLLEDGQTIDEEKMKAMEVITYKDFEKALKKKTATLVLLGYDSCYWCQQQKPILEMLMHEKDLDVKYLKTTELTKEQLDELAKLNEELDGFGTPTIIMLKNKKVTIVTSEAKNRTGLITAFTKAGILKEEK